MYPVSGFVKPQRYNPNGDYPKRDQGHSRFITRFKGYFVKYLFNYCGCLPRLFKSGLAWASR